MDVVTSKGIYLPGRQEMLLIPKFFLQIMDTKHCHVVGCYFGFI